MEPGGTCRGKRTPEGSGPRHRAGWASVSASAWVKRDRSFINQNGPCHKKQGPFPQKYDFAKRKSCWLRGCVWWKNFAWFFCPFFFFSLQFFFISLHCKFFARVGFCFCFCYKTLALNDSHNTDRGHQSPPLGPQPSWGLWGPPLAFVWLFSLSLPRRLAPVGRCGVLG